MAKTPFKARPFRKLINKLADGLVDEAIRVVQSKSPVGLRPDIEVELTLKGHYDWTDDDELVIGGRAEGLPSGIHVEASGGYESDSESTSGERLTLHVRFRVHT